MCIGMKIKELASKEKITLPELAEKLGKTKQAIYDMVDKEDMNTSIVRKCAEIFNVPVSYFFGEAVAQTAANSDNVLLAERVRHLEELLAEKERLIKVLMDRK